MQLQNPRKKEIHILGITNFPIPEEPGFPLYAIYAQPASEQKDEVMLWQEVRWRLCEKVFEPHDDKPITW